MLQQRYSVWFPEPLAGEGGEGVAVGVGGGAHRAPQPELLLELREVDPAAGALLV